VLCFRDGQVTQHSAVDAAWLRPESGALVWADLADPTPEEGRMLSTVFGFHELAIEDALSALHHPKAETYENILYLIVHGIDFEAARHRFATHDTDFFLGPGYLVTVHDGRTRSIPQTRELCLKGPHIMQEGVLALTHRIVDQMVNHYRPEVEKLTEQLDELERRVFETPHPNLLREILELKQDVASLRRVVLPQRDVIARLARREFPMVTETLAYRFRDVHDHLVRLADEAMHFQDRITGLLDAHLASASNRLNQTMKVLTLIATIFMPLTVLTGMYGMNVDLPHLPGGPAAQFWWIVGMLGVISAGMLWFFRTRDWF
jgi:magnesium transporter